MQDSKYLKYSIAGVLTFAVLKRLLTSPDTKSSSLSHKSTRKLQQIQAEISLSHSLPSPSPSLVSKITSSSIQELQSLLDSQEITCVDIFTSFVHTMREQSSPLNCISDLSLQKGLKRAKKLDQELKSGHKRGNLHGIPISIKDLIAVKGLTSTFGCIEESFATMDEDAELVKYLKSRGALIYVKGSMSQNAASYETCNGVTGRCLNPQDRGRTPGGSSGGDAVLVATRGTSVAIGTDIGGSLRYPALCCGVFSLKPTSHRVTRTGPLQLQDFPHLKNAWGPLAKHFEDLKLLAQEIFNCKASSYIPHLPWRDEVFGDKAGLNVAVCFGDKYWPVPKCFLKEIERSQRALELRGHKVKVIDLQDEIKEITGIVLRTMAYDLRDEKRLAGERVLCHLEKIENAAKAGPVRRFLAEKWKRWRYGEKEAIYYEKLGNIGVNEYLENIVDLRIFKDKFLRKVDADVLVFPYPFSAVLHDSSGDLFNAFSYLAIFNVLDWPVGHLPTGVVEESEDYLPGNSEPWAKAMRRNLADSKGLPVGVQVAGMPFMEEKVLRIMGELNEDLDKFR